MQNSEYMNMSRKPPKSTKREYPRKKQPRIIPAVTGNWRCSYRWCIVCPKIKEGSSFRSKVTGREYSILSPASCYTRSCIYLITCTKPTCGKQYAGKCKPSLGERHNGHMKEIRNQSSALSKHFRGPGGCGSEAFFIQIIETDVKLDKLRKVEEDWQQDLGQANPRPLQKLFSRISDRFRIYIKLKVSLSQVMSRVMS